ncbi:hypothetical protein BC936DRAFT_142103 [Jimgerdemannia flammicorona]|uniref:ADP-ribosylation factor family-domain-containing protein n=1 Tax=Jimgerdemannia flammicorona TaxID=994334 RepID=A0A433DFJ1_9FUNG|nr:hypothetical protein BC936DRAFT_142103 [Jimgerdemannia flammicorona]
MGQWFSLIINVLGSPKDLRILMVGLDAAGKTTILYKLKLGERVSTIPTIGNALELQSSFQFHRCPSHLPMPFIHSLSFSPGFNVETVNWNNKLNFTIWDVGGQDAIRPLWRHYYQNSRAIIFVVDAADRDPDRIATAREELTHMLQEHELRDVTVLVLANKQDLPNAMSVDEVTQALGLTSMPQGRRWHVRGTCAVTGDGVYEGLDWLAKTLRSQE